MYVKFISYSFIKYVTFFYIGGKCECFILVINDILEYNLPYVQSDFTCNPGPTIFISSRYY